MVYLIAFGERMIDLFYKNNLEKTFAKFLRDSSELNEMLLINQILTEDENIPNFDAERVKHEVIKFSVDCLLKPEKFDFNPGERTALQDTFFGVKKGCTHGPMLEHIIYVNPNMIDRVSFVKNFLNICERLNVDFDFEYTLDSHASNGVTIFSTEEQLGQYRRVLDTIEIECPQIIKRCRSTPLDATNLGWYAYKPMNNKVASAVYAGFAKTLIDYYSLSTPKRNLKRNFGVEFYTKLAQKNDIGYGNFMIDEFVKNKFVKYQDKTLDCITHNGISLNDIVQNSQLTLPKEVKTNKMAKATVADYVHVLRKKGVHIESYVQKNMFVDLLKQNVRDSMSKYNIVSSLPESLVSNKKAMTLTKIASNKASTKA